FDGPKRNERIQRPPLAPLAPHQPRAARDAADALERGGVGSGPRRVQEGTRPTKRDPASWMVQLGKEEGEWPLARSPRSQLAPPSASGERCSTPGCTGSSRPASPAVSRRAPNQSLSLAATRMTRTTAT